MTKEVRKTVKVMPKMLPEGARRGPNQGLEGSGALPGAMWAQSGRQERFKSLLVAARGGPGGEKKTWDRPRGRLGAKS